LKGRQDEVAIALPTRSQTAVDSLLKNIDVAQFASSIERRTADLSGKIESHSFGVLDRLQKQEEAGGIKLVEYYIDHVRSEPE
jgi:hypothetical protein